jgi:hypothetical protein
MSVLSIASMVLALEWFTTANAYLKKQNKLQNNQ